MDDSHQLAHALVEGGAAGVGFGVPGVGQFLFVLGDVGTAFIGEREFRALAFASPLSALLLLGGCTWFGGDGETSALSVQSAGARHLVVGDEPFAVRTAGAVLAQGGSAVDAAASMFFALSVTYPVAATADAKGDAATRYLRFLQTPAAKAIFEKYGFSFLVKPAA